MFRLSHEELHRRRTTKPIQSIDELFEGLGFDDLDEPGVKVKISTDFTEVFEQYACIVNPEGGGKRVYVFSALLLLDSMCRTWQELYTSVASSREEVLREKTLLEQEVQNLSNQEDQRMKKLSGELDVSRQKLREIQDAFAQRGVAIANLEQQLLALSL